MKKQILTVLGGLFIAFSANAEQYSQTQPKVNFSQVGLNLFDGFFSSFIDSKVQQTFKEWVGSDVGVTEFSATGFTRGKPVFEALITRPLYESENYAHTVFYQASINRADDRTTGNLGLGYRHLMYDNRLLLGVNAFYDHELPYNHQRMSIGGEIRTSVAELNANYYAGLSDWRDIGNDLEEKALGGYDLEARVALPYLPFVKAGVKTFRWFALDGEPDLVGQTYSLTGSLPHGFSIEAGRTVQDTQPDYDYVKLIYNVGGRGNNKSQLFISEQAYALESMVDHRLDKVRRENRIIKQTRGRPFIIRVTGF